MMILFVYDLDRAVQIFKPLPLRDKATQQALLIG
jgi:hypothetical protein